jgi:hypothetical protein
MVHRLLADMLEGEEKGEFWKADALFVQLAREGKANAAVAAATICSIVTRRGVTPR